MTRSTFREFDKNWELFGTFFSYCPNFRTTNSKVWTVLSTDDILLYSNIVQTFELRTLKFGLYNPLKKMCSSASTAPPTCPKCPLSYLVQ